MDEAACVGLPGVREQVEAFVQATFGVGVEIRGTLSGVGAGTPSLAGSAALF